jgi:serine protease Do
MQDNLDPETVRSLGLKDGNGVLIVVVEDNTPAARAGVMPGDFITEFNGQAIENHKDLAMAVIRTPVGETVAIKLWRRGVAHTLKITVSDGSELKTGLHVRPPPKAVAEETLAPYNLGFTVVDYTPALATRLPISPLRKPHPVILTVEPESEASRVGLVPGDVIIDVNRREVTHVREAISNLRKGTINILKVAKPGRMVLVSMRAT